MSAWLAVIAQLLVFPLFSLSVSFGQDLAIATLFTVNPEVGMRAEETIRILGTEVIPAANSGACRHAADLRIQQ